MSEPTIFVCVECGTMDPAFVVVCHKCQRRHTAQLQSTITKQAKEIESLRKNNNIYWQALYYISDNDLYPDGCRKWAKQALTPTEPMITEGARIDERNKHERSSKIL